MVSVSVLHSFRPFKAEKSQDLKDGCESTRRQGRVGQRKSTYEGLGREALLGVLHPPLLAQSWAENSGETCGESQARRREHVLSVWD